MKKLAMRILHHVVPGNRVSANFRARDVTVHALEKEGRTIRFSVRGHRFMLVLDETGRVGRRGRAVETGLARPNLWLEQSASFIGMSDFLDTSAMCDTRHPETIRQAQDIVLTIFNAAMPSNAAEIYQDTLDFVRMMVDEAGFEQGQLLFPGPEIESGSGKSVPAPYCTQLPSGFHALRFHSGGGALTLERLVEGGRIHSFASMPPVLASASGHELLALRARKADILKRFGMKTQDFDAWAIAVQRTREA